LNYVDSIIALKDLMLGCFYTEYEDLKEYSLLFLGAVLRDISLGGITEGTTYKLDEPAEGSVCKARKNCLAATLSHANSWLKKKGFKASTIMPNFDFLSSSEELTRIFAHFLEQYPSFSDLLARRELACLIKYQVGYKFF
jgi:hypothetical protein